MREFPAVNIVGGLFAPDLLDKLLAEELPGQKPRDFGMDGRRSLTDEIAAAFADAMDLWRVFQHRLERLQENDLGTTVTRDAWLIPFLGLLGYELQYNRKAYNVGGMTFAISHRAGEAEESPPVHIVGVRQELGRLAPSGVPRLAPHSLVQEYLNRTDVLWGLVTNGKVLRLLRDSTYIRRQCYMEFDLEAIFEQNLFQDFAVLYRLLHRTRLPRARSDAHLCFLEQYYQHSLEQGGRVRDHLRDGVEKCIKYLANGFLSHPKNDELRLRVRAAPDSSRITHEELYHQLLRLVYRFLFLLVSEDRGLISQNPLYLKHYSVSRMRRLVDHQAAYTEHNDLWLSLRVLWRLLSDDTPVQELGGKPKASLLDLPVLDGALFEPLDIDKYLITNKDLLVALWYLINYQDTPSSPPRRVNYAALDVEELGSVYESLLDYHPQIDTTNTYPRFELVTGSERKTTGSYYTPAELVAELTRSALEPVIVERLKNASSVEDKERALLSIRVVDPACGSGHFLLAAARRLGRELARIRTGEEEPAPERVREATRDVIAHCIYGVDKNPLAVELCRVALWIEGHTPGKPLTFLDHRIKCGDSLVGVFDLKSLDDGIPDEAFSPVSGDDSRLASRLKGQNRRERQNMPLSVFDKKAKMQILKAESVSLSSIKDDSIESILHKKKRYESLQQTTRPIRTACDLWTAAFFQPMSQEMPDGMHITTGVLRKCLSQDDADSEAEYALRLAQKLAQKQHFFHWPVEFPEVLADGGFDVILCNPPWDVLELDEQEFFDNRDFKIANASNADARERLIQQLRVSDPQLWHEYSQALHSFNALRKFLRESGYFPLTARGRTNTYSVFAERIRKLLKSNGRAGIIVPTGIATDDTNKKFFASLVENYSLASLYDFENREGLFPSVHRSYKFCLLTLRGAQDGRVPAEFVFFATRTEHLDDKIRRFALTSEDIRRFNPNTNTCPVFRTNADAEITRAIYRRTPVIINKVTGENPWGVTFKQGLFNMSSDSHLFRTRAQLEEEGFRRIGNRFVKDGEVWLPLYEAKMIWHYDHRYGTYAGVDGRSSTHLPRPSEEEHADPGYLIQPWYWVNADEVNVRLGEWKKGWLIGFRRVTNATNERTAIFSMMPRVGVGNTMPLVLTMRKPMEVIALIANLTSFAFDFVVRLKMGGMHLGFFIIEQLPVLPPSAYSPQDLLFIAPRVLEMAYTAWDIKPFADDVWRGADEPLRRAIRAQWEANCAETGGHTWNLPEWIDAYPEIETDPQKGVPFPPFRWNASRRSILQAELDAYYAHLYGLTRKQLRYILDPADLTEKELEDILDPFEEIADPLEPRGYDERVKKSTFVGETFRVLKDNEKAEYGEYRTRRLVLEAWERLNGQRRG